MAVHKIKDKIYSVGAIDWDRRLFDELIPLPEGTSYNAYLIEGEDKTVLIDTVDPRTEKDLFLNLENLGVEKIDYVISNHAEQDHSGSIPTVLEWYPDSKVVTNEKCKSMLMDLLKIPEEKFKVIEDGETLALGGKNLEFIKTPWVHWPETMVTYLKEDRILFSCDFFGSHLATSNLYTEDIEKELRDAKRYFAEIMMPFSPQIKRNLEKLDSYQIDMIAPSHGPIYTDPEIIMEAYEQWISGEVKNKVIIPYVSMHGSTRNMVDHLYDFLVERGIKTTPFNLLETDTGSLAIELVDTATLILATPTILAGPHPNAVYAAVLLNALKPPVKNLGIIGSYGWGGKTVETIKGLVPNVKAELLEPYLAKGHPGPDDYDKLEELADTIQDKHEKMGLL